MWAEISISIVVTAIACAAIFGILYSSLKKQKSNVDEKLSNLDAKITNLSQYVTSNFVAGTQFDDRTEGIDTRITGTNSTLSTLDQKVSTFKKTVENGDYAYNIMRFA
jgi:hypothetical protein